jgi:hypothetical protein
MKKLDKEGKLVVEEPILLGVCSGWQEESLYEEGERWSEFPLTSSIRLVTARAGMQSLIGVGHRLPVPWGNYFSLYDGTQIVNMWVENMEKLVRNETLEDGKILIRYFEQDYMYQPWHVIDPSKSKEENKKPDLKRATAKWGVVVDERVPKDWLYQPLCFTGGTIPPKTVILEMYRLTGYSGFKMWEYLEPETYHKALGHRVSKGWVTSYFGKNTKAQLDNTVLDFVI